MQPTQEMELTLVVDGSVIIIKHDEAQETVADARAILGAIITRSELGEPCPFSVRRVGGDSKKSTFLAILDVIKTSELVLEDGVLSAAESRPTRPKLQKLAAALAAAEEAVAELGMEEGASSAPKRARVDSGFT